MRDSRRSSFNDPGHAHFLTFSCFRRAQIFADEQACRLFAKSLDDARTQLQFELWSYVLMPEHVHLLIKPTREGYSISHILKAIKGPFGKRVIGYLRQEYPSRLKKLAVQTPAGTAYRVWQRGGGYDRNLYSLDTIERAIKYIEWNPVRRGYIEEPVQWKWSSANARIGDFDVPIQVDEVRWEETNTC